MARTDLSNRGSNILTDKQRMFVAEYLIDFNATRAAKAVGYKNPNKTGSLLLKQPAVVRALGKAQKDMLLEKKLTKEIVLTQLLYLVTRNAMDFADENGMLTTDLTKLNQRALESIDGIEQIHYIDEEGHNCTKTKLKLTPKMSAIEAAMKHLSLFAPTEVNHTHTLNFDEIAGAVTVDDRSDIEQRLLTLSTPPMPDALGDKGEPITDVDFEPVKELTKSEKENLLKKKGTSAKEQVLNSTEGKPHKQSRQAVVKRNTHPNKKYR